MDMSHGHSEWITAWTSFTDMKHGNAACKCSIKNTAWTCCTDMDMQPQHAAWRHGHAAWTNTMEKQHGMQHGYAAWTFSIKHSMDMDMRLGHGHAARQ
jgi:hypothetical protein